MLDSLASNSTVALADEKDDSGDDGNLLGLSLL